MVRKTRSGWVIETAQRRDGALVSGGICGREVLYKTATLEKVGISYHHDPMFIVDLAGTRRYEQVMRLCDPDRILKAGWKIV